MSKLEIFENWGRFSSGDLVIFLQRVYEYEYFIYILILSKIQS